MGNYVWNTVQMVANLFLIVIVDASTRFEWIAFDVSDPLGDLEFVCFYVSYVQSLFMSY